MAHNYENVPMLIIEILYLISTSLLATYGLNSAFHAWLYRRNRGAAKSSADNLTANHADLQYPYVTVQLPVYNERHVVTRLIDAVAAFDWPIDRLQIQVLDDSTDDTAKLIVASVAKHTFRGIQIEHVQRTDRTGYKAGALSAGLETATGEFIAIFDADFIPPTNFLQETIPYFTDDHVGCVQTRWGHVNPNTSWLTRSQALGIDGHFVIEQDTRHRLGAFMNFNGTAGVWRSSCMSDAGGWQGDTLTEDLDLSYRAQLNGWRIVFASQVIVPAELPVQIDAFKRQQFRWAKGSIQTAMKLLGPVWQSPTPLWKRLLGTLHLTNYLVHPLMLINLLLILPMSFSQSPLLNLALIFACTAIGPPLMYWAAMDAGQIPWSARLPRLALLVALGTGLSVNNTKAVIEAICGIQSGFKRTPKFAVTRQSEQWQTSTYTLPRDPTAWFEVLLGIYAFSLLIFGAINGIWWLFPWLLLYVGGYFYIAYLAFAQAWQLRITRSLQWQTEKV
ncbi:glycosyltransferase family 2 protein [Chloroflexi bacterium TSY]|nr:glycosyltransferase family 2 protein [Chloroflexi bacterium TSY]